MENGVNIGDRASGFGLHIKGMDYGGLAYCLNFF